MGDYLVIDVPWEDTQDKTEECLELPYEHRYLENMGYSNHLFSRHFSTNIARCEIQYMPLPRYSNRQIISNCLFTPVSITSEQ